MDIPHELISITSRNFRRLYSGQQPTGITTVFDERKQDTVNCEIILSQCFRLSTSVQNVQVATIVGDCDA